MRSHSRDMVCPGFANSLLPLEQRAQGKPGADGTRSPRAKKSTGVELQVQPNNPGFPRAMVLRLIRALPGEAAFLAPVVSGILPADVAPGSRRQDHTTSPFAVAFSSGGKTPPDAAASIASCALRIVTIAKRPLRGRGTGELCAPISISVKQNIFMEGGLTRFC